MPAAWTLLPDPGLRALALRATRRSPPSSAALLLKDKLLATLRENALR
jgi:hypothetical protein